MGWKSTKTLTRETIIEKIERELSNNIDELSDNTLCYVLEILCDDENTETYSGYNYSVGAEDEYLKY